MHTLNGNLQLAFDLTDLQISASKLLHIVMTEYHGLPKVLMKKPYQDYFRQSNLKFLETEVSAHVV